MRVGVRIGMTLINSQSSVARGIFIRTLEKGVLTFRHLAGVVKNSCEERCARDSLLTAMW
jgi:hypothetical protein